MGEVWAATQVTSGLGLQKLIALKILESSELDSNAALMFRDEATAASVLQHAAIVPTIDLGQDGDRLYIAMELVRGPSLTALLQRLVLTKRVMTPAMVAHVGIQIASALDYAYARATYQGRSLRLVHRDVSPHNVLLDLNGAVRLTDFGVARTDIQTHQSHVGTVRGKPSYMAPEQVAGGEIDARTDVFALGIVLYECSCLRRLFGRSNPVKSMDAVVKHQPRPLTELVPGFPPQLWAAIARALEKDPARRHPTAGEFCEALMAANRSLEDASRAPRELVSLIGAVFEPGAFDVDGKVQEELRTGELEDPAQQEPTRAERRRSRPASSVSVVPVASTEMQRSAWPAPTYAPDPLAPEALEELRTQFLALTPSLPLERVPESDPGRERATTTRNTATRQRSFAPRQVVAMATVVTATALLAGAFVGSRARTPNTPLPTTSPSPEPVAATPSASPTIGPGARAAPRTEPLAVVPRAAVAADLPRAEGSPEPPRAPPIPPRKPSPVTTATSPPPPPTRPVTSPVPEPSAPPSAASDASFDEVRELVRRVKAVDPARGKAMFATLAEAGRDNVERLNQLRREARQFLQGGSAP